MYGRVIKIMLIKWTIIIGLKMVAKRFMKEQ